ncbi:MAG: DNA-binding response regulator [Gammaproteobacteria bacterium RIFOXYA12_FULL_61_12]|nr:MAG: DNA-binding response regulator [Gammaproteobacteria bacterium RIFOXYD12_FULL_61_37]OGT92610.1 MAG: DNA-binding response regulator [Gammaproteobacteria bacterium RIFOXYA12_FULL_61_12]
MRILIVEDDGLLADSLIRAMAAAGYAADLAGDGELALKMLLDGCYDLAILDLNLPRLDGLAVLKQLRAARRALPVIILTARDMVEDRVKGLDLGADDYLTKPFSLAELEARVRALLRRGQGGGGACIECGDLSFDSAGRRASLCDETLDLSARELAVLETLLFRQGKVVSKEQLIDSLCAWDEEVSPNAIEVYIHRLRKKLEPGGVVIRTLRGLGYLMDKA